MKLLAAEQNPVPFSLSFFPSPNNDDTFFTIRDTLLFFLGRGALAWGTSCIQSRKPIGSRGRQHRLWRDRWTPQQQQSQGLADTKVSRRVTRPHTQHYVLSAFCNARCPNYPQDLIVHLLCGPARIAKVQILSHHYKIATKIDVYVGVAKEPADVPVEFEEPLGDDDDDMVVEFTRLGWVTSCLTRDDALQLTFNGVRYVCLDSNTRAQFRARELKSIKVNADGEYVRLVIRNCHQNRLNTYNQVTTPI